jgi:hypothetical protein
MARDAGLAREIEEAKKSLGEETKRKEKEADDTLDALLSKRKMEFCPRCKRKVGSRSEWAGKCMHDGCDEILCADCFASEEKRYCKKHRDEYRKPETMEPGDDDVRILTFNYMDFIDERVKKFGLDWSPSGYMRKTKAKVRKKKYGEFELMIFEKRLLSKKLRIRIFVRPMTKAFEADAEDVVENLQDDVYAILALVGNPSFITQRAERFAREFSNKKFSLFIMDMENGSLHFNPKEKITEKYSLWFDPTKMPARFADLLKSVSESESGRKVVSVKRFGEELGMANDEAMRLLRTSGLLEEVAGTGTFIIRE